VHFKNTPQGEYLGIYGPNIKFDIITFAEIKWHWGKLTELQGW
jgi:hypothetical protein